jgi:hypothetical protein
MSNVLTSKLKLSTQEQAQLGSKLGKLKSLAVFFSDAIDSLKDTKLVEAVAEAAPWAGIFGGALAEVVPPVKFALELFKGLTDVHDPDALGFLASTLAYQRAVEQTIASLESSPSGKKAGQEVKDELRTLEPSVETDFKKFSFKTALEHPFVKQADEVLRKWVESVGYGKAQSRIIVIGVHRRFVPNLKTILSHGELKEKFAPFTQKMELGTEEEQAYDALLEHTEYQRWLFEEAPVFEKEPFALEHVYVDTECGKLTWGQISKDQQLLDKGQGKEHERVDPFSEKWGDRKPLLSTVLDMIGDPTLKDAIVIQGVAGSGKSSFTLKLCSELIREGLHPLRVRLRDLSLSRPVTEALPRALFPSDKYLSSQTESTPRPDDLFLGGSIFNEVITYRSAKISPYVLILDGWDEISISATKGFKVRVTDMLTELRSEYLKNRAVPVRIILTGRPSNAVSESKFLLDKTPVLTVRPLHPDQLNLFVGKLQKALTDRPIKIEVKDEDETWKITDPTRFDTVIARYKEEFELASEATNKERQTAASRETDAAQSGSMAVMGLPLLAHLAIRLMSKWKGDDLSALVQNPTTLYRSLVDLTCEKGGKSIFDNTETEEQFRITGGELRQLLWQTATAMSVYGQENISFRELALRLDLEDEDLDRKVSSAAEDHKLSSLMVSFFFKGGQLHLGCEFLHKSFREYLYAEGIVEALKEYGRGQKKTPDERTPYWADFPETDSRRDFSRTLSAALSAQWLSHEVVGHLEQLLIWEIAREKAKEEAEVIGTPTEPLDIAGWSRVRDGLADLWDWWGEGVHLRPQVLVDKKTRVASFENPYVQELVEQAAPFDPMLRNASLEPKRTLTMDAHLGDGLFRLAALVHYYVAVNSGWLENRSREVAGSFPVQIWEGVSPVGQGPRRCQSIVKQQGGEWTLFAPSGTDSRFFANYVHRINSAGWRPHESFPLGVNLSGVDLRRVAVEIPMPATYRIIRTVWTHANLSDANAAGGNFYDHVMAEILADGISFWQSFLVTADFDNASLKKAELGFGILRDANLSNTDLQSAVLDNAYLSYSNLENANVAGARFKDANLEGAGMWNIKLEGDELEGAIGIESAQIIEQSDIATEETQDRTGAAE